MSALEKFIARILEGAEHTAPSGQIYRRGGLKTLGQRAGLEGRRLKRALKEGPSLKQGLAAGALGGAGLGTAIGLSGSDEEEDDSLPIYLTEEDLDNLPIYNPKDYR